MVGAVVNIPVEADVGVAGVWDEGEVVASERSGGGDRDLCGEWWRGGDRGIASLSESERAWWREGMVDR